MAPSIDAGSASPERPTGADESPLIGVDGRAFSVKALLLAAVLLTVGSLLGSLVPLIGGSIGRLVGLLIGAFVVGLVFSRRRYVESALAGAGVGTASTLLSILSVGFLPVGLHFLQDYGIGLAAVGAVIGLLAALVGTYFGRDLRAGLTQSIE